MLKPACFFVPFALALTGASCRAEGDSHAEAQRVFDCAGVRDGLVVHVGCGDGRLTAALRCGEHCLVQGLETDPAKVEVARRNIQSLGGYGPVSVDRWDGRSLPYVDNLVNLLVAEDLGALDRDEIIRVLAPGGAVCVKRGGQWGRTTKPWPPGIDEWTHWLHGADGNAVARDTVVGPPRHVQWVDGPRWQRHHDTVPSTSAVVSAGGRLFAIEDHALPGIDALPDQWWLVARDAFNGLLLWKRPIAEWGWAAWSDRSMSRFNQPTQLPRRLVAAGDRVYATLGFNAPVSALDAATGKELMRYAQTDRADEVLYHNGVLLVDASSQPNGPGTEGEPPGTRSVLALDAESGRLLWRRDGFHGASSKAGALERSSHLLMVAGGKGLFLVDRDAVVGLDPANGKTIWRRPRPEVSRFVTNYNYYFANLTALVYHDDVVLFAQPELNQKRQLWNEPAKGELWGLSAASGELLWQHPCGAWGHYNPPDVLVIDGLVWVHKPDEFALVGLDPRSGQVRRTFSTAKALDQAHHHRCYQNKATERYVLTGRRGVEFVDVQNEEIRVHPWVRGVCRFGIVPCNGLIYAPPHPCICYLTAKLNGFYALAGDRRDSRTREPPRLERGPAFGATSHRSTFHVDPAEDWPTYRHDALRSGATGSVVPPRLEPVWKAQLGARPSSPVVAGGVLLAAVVDAHRVEARRADDGAPLWTYTAGARVDTPPTVADGRVVFGGADGWICCLRLADGRLLWRRRAAPREQRLVACGQLESVWPLHGSVLVHEGGALFAAGRSSFLDGGIVLGRVDVETGTLLHEARLESRDPKTGETDQGQLPYDMPEDKPGALPDVLVSDGRLASMRNWQFDARDLSGLRPVPPAFPAGSDRARRREQPGVGAHLTAGGGLLDSNLFNQTSWTIDGRAHAKLLVFNGDTACGFTPQRDAQRHSRAIFRPGTKGYTLFAHDRRGDKLLWSIQVPLRVAAMVLAGPTLFVAGTPDVVDPADPWGAIEGRRGAQLWAVRAADGEKLAERSLDAPPVFDGMAAARGRLYLSTVDGRVLCFGGPSE